MTGYVCDLVSRGDRYHTGQSSYLPVWFPDCPIVIPFLAGIRNYLLSAAQGNLPSTLGHEPTVHQIEIN